MGYNDPMPTEPAPCDCGAAPFTYNANSHWFVQCDECGMTGPVAFACAIAVFFWSMSSLREIAPDNLRVALRENAQ